MTTPPSGQGPSDEELVARVRAGDRGATSELVRRHRPRVLALVRRYLASDAQAEDVVQLVFVRADARLDQFRGESLYRTWLYRVAVNVALNERRAEGRMRPLEEAPDASTNPFATMRMVARETRERLPAAISLLPPKQRRVIELRLLEELPFSEIAGMCDCSEDAAKANYHFGIKKLRELLRS